MLELIVEADPSEPLPTPLPVGSPGPQRLLDDGNILTPGRVAAAIDLCLHIIRIDYGLQIVNLNRHGFSADLMWVAAHG